MNGVGQIQFLFIPLFIYHTTSLLRHLPRGHKESTSASHKLFSGKAKSISQDSYLMTIHLKIHLFHELLEMNSHHCAH